MRIYFARHGESQANLLHEISNRGLRHGLTRKGREQAHLLGESLSNHGIMYIYSSPILRAIETSIILANQLNVDYEIVDGLREYDCGLVEGHADEDSWQQWHMLFDSWTVKKQWQQCIEGGETFFDIRNRFVPFVDGLINKFDGTETKVLCVAHGGIYRLMLPLIFKNYDEKILEQQGIEYTSYIISEVYSGDLFCVEWNGKTFNIPQSDLQATSQANKACT